MRGGGKAERHSSHLGKELFLDELHGLLRLSVPSDDREDKFQQWIPPFFI